MPEFEELLAAVRTDCAARPLPAAEELRHIGSRRNHRRRVLVTGTVAATVTGVAVAAALVVPGRAASPPPVGPATTSTSPSTSTSQIGGAPPTCQASQLGPTPAIHTGIAGGSLGITVTFTNQSTTTCRLDDSVTLWSAEPKLPPTRVPTTPSGNPAPVLAPGAKGTARIEWTDGYGGYQSSAPECNQPKHYHGLFIVEGGARFPLPGITLDVLCGGVFADWEAS
ncbi:DUF4232 domain-containing protein [Catenulispora rubra]|uniref:DUF4232 domain-containing protein n=1 Tax=Catenulispora rubra TaxID=280293 RepID=UPI0018920DC2|nr:DUF4232 domain-containing protein [Catenulispora rubra]